ncbi:MAG: hypothetical protein JRK53_08960 [Deltaproteobacteria bacterium]|nr:hypothetical protein [Deltaproteobacteria bacterium]
MSAENKNGKSVAEKVSLFRSCFPGLTHVYGTYDPDSGHARQVKAHVTDEVILAHLRGRRPYGVYLLVKDRIRAIAVDFDTNDTLPPTGFVTRAKHYGISACIERSKSKGHHAWIFFEECGVPAFKARLVVNHILHEIEESETEVFPKQDALDGNLRYGNFINAPLFGALVPKGKTVFVDPNTFAPFADQWAFLESTERAREDLLDEIIEINKLFTPPRENRRSSSVRSGGERRGFGLPSCARKMLRDGVGREQRVSCFRLAVNLKKLGLPYDVTVAALKTWALKNRPGNGRGVIKESEIVSQTSCAYEKSYISYGCEEPAVIAFCDESCPVKQWMRNADMRSHTQIKKNKKPSCA